MGQHEPLDPIWPEAPGGSVDHIVPVKNATPAFMSLLTSSAGELYTPAVVIDLLLIVQNEPVRANNSLARLENVGRPLSGGLNNPDHSAP